MADARDVEAHALKSKGRGRRPGRRGARPEEPRAWPTPRDVGGQALTIHGAVEAQSSRSNAPATAAATRNTRRAEPGTEGRDDVEGHGSGS
jgi:hypothetical protein